MDSSSLKSGEIRITMNMKGGIPVGYSTKGAGISPPRQDASHEKDRNTRKPTKLTPSTDIPAIATKTAKAEDIYKVR